jgi:hypothetical protein
MPVTRHPPHRSVREKLHHTAPFLSIWCQILPMPKGGAMLFSASSECKCCERTSRAFSITPETPQKKLFPYSLPEHNGLHEKRTEIDHVHLCPAPPITAFWPTLTYLVAKLWSRLCKALLIPDMRKASRKRVWSSRYFQLNLH